MPVIGKES
ncbi:hypothetical protein CGLO_18258 [Colletotrichum gloeosporioides Cg-14]|uniref:Uncharacterized protein n=1 Tax=Colletotrichum gloeosporioides (strain Cg-14) TaxID=1237896 RepID=T0L4H9_COLGC|nr:hypothetical protein CGLO_18258 [Colletotrichum gloeosporioides Cg-14]